MLPLAPATPTRARFILKGVPGTSCVIATAYPVRGGNSHNRLRRARYNETVASAHEERRRTLALTAPADGVEGNRRLTGATAAVLFALLFVEGVTIVALGSLMPVHVFVGILLIPPVALKLSSTGWRMVRYYQGSPPYRLAGPPALPLRALGPVIAVATALLLGSGVAMLALGPGAHWARGLHQASFLLFFVTMSVHVLAHLRRVPALASADVRPEGRTPAGAMRQLVLAGALVAGILLAALALQYDGAWVHLGRFAGGG
jgi:hypothetical protein